jgi:uncharacterized membrane protein YbhN (UPF0104 family)
VTSARAAEKAATVVRRKRLAPVRRWLRLLGTAGSLGLAAWLLVIVVPHIAGGGWSGILAQFQGIGIGVLIGLAVLWFGGLWAYTYVLTGSLPGLRNGQAFALNAAGSAVSNLLPFGGAAGVAVTAAMASSWGHTVPAIATSTVVSGVWNIAARLVLPVLAVIALAGSGVVVDQRVITVTWVAAAVLAAALVVLALPERWLKWAPIVVRSRQNISAVVRTGWAKMTVGMGVYLALQGVLLWACLSATGVWLGLGATVAAFAVSRLLTLVVITPGGVGVTENGTIALLVALGHPAASAAAGVLLFAFFTFAIEIPVGGLAWLIWSVRRARSA